MLEPSNHLFDRAFSCLNQTQPAEKVRCTQALYESWLQGELVTESACLPVPVEIPGRPDQPELVHPRDVPKRSFKSELGRVRLTHAITHIEFNAINLALDAAYRFREMPDQYYTDWLRVAAEEALHFTLLNDYLQSKGSEYGAYAAHNGLWEMALKTDHDVMVRMALVPRVLEARGLDVTPGMIEKLKCVGDHELVDCLEIIFRDEIGHVQIGSHWFNYCCQQRSLPSEQIFNQLLDDYMQGAVFGPLDEDVRIKAGFSRQELSDLMGRAQSLYDK